jgi:hypothetical protein
MPTLRGIDYDIRPGYPKEYFGPDGAEITNKYICAWADRIALMEMILGWWRGGTFYPPHEYVAEGPAGVFKLYGDSCSINPIVATSSDTYSYPKAELTVIYRRKDYFYELEDKIYFTERLEPASEFITLDRKGLYWGTGASAVRIDDENVEVPTKINRMVDWVFTLYNIRYITDSYFDMVGKVNSVAIKPRTLYLTFPIGTLLCSNPSADREFTRRVEPTWKVTFRFTYKNNGTIAAPKGWNFFPRTDGGTISWERITDASSNVDIYDSYDFNSVIRL